MLIMFGLLPLIVLSFISIMFGNEFVGINIAGVKVTKGTDVYQSKPIFFNLDPLTVGLEIIIVVALACAILGIRILASGLSEQSVRLLSVGLCYTAIWAFLSLLAYPLIRSIDIFGTSLYILLTMVFTIGVIQKMIGD